jgi:hypothetical protein
MKHCTIYPALGVIFAIAACSDAVEGPRATAPEQTGETTLVAPSPEPAPLTYGDAYYLTDFWAGEYSNGFAVPGSDVVVQARSQMHIDAPKDVACPLPQNANFHPWNIDRAQADGLEFRSVIEKTAIAITADVSLDADVEDADTPVTLELKTGDTLTYLSYVGEGYFIAEYDDREYLLNEGELNNAADFAQASNPPQQWVLVKCTSSAPTRAWVLLSDALAKGGILGMQLAGYGEAYDLDDERMAEAFSP